VGILLKAWNLGVNMGVFPCCKWQGIFLSSLNCMTISFTSRIPTLSSKFVVLNCFTSSCRKCAKKFAKKNLLAYTIRVGLLQGLMLGIFHNSSSACVSNVFHRRCATSYCKE